MFSGIEKFEHGFKPVLQIECANKINKYSLYLNNEKFS